MLCMACASTSPVQLTNAKLSGVASPGQMTCNAGDSLTTEMDMDKNDYNGDSQESKVDDYYFCDARRHLHEIV